MESRTFGHLKRLLRLDLSGNRLVQLQDGIFDGLYSLKEISLLGNMFTTLPDTPFENLPRPLLLLLSFNPMQCDARLCWLHQEKIAGSVTWQNTHRNETFRTHCADGTDLEEIKCNDGKCSFQFFWRTTLNICGRFS